MGNKQDILKMVKTAIRIAEAEIVKLHSQIDKLTVENKRLRKNASQVLNDELRLENERLREKIKLIEKRVGKLHVD